MTSAPITTTPPEMGEVAGRAVALRYGDVGREYAALRRSAMLIDRSQRARVLVTGPKAADTLTGLVTNDVSALVPGQGQYAAALTPKGKIIADLRIFARAGGDLLLDTPPRAAEGWWTMVRKFVNPRLARFTDVSTTLHDLGIFGPRAREIVAAFLQGVGVDPHGLESLGSYSHLSFVIGDGDGMAIRAPELDVEGYDLIIPADQAETVWQRLVSLGATPGGLDAWEIARIEAGRPEWGLDIDDGTLPQEANLEELHAISYTKGCYTGQETVARVHFRGHVNRHLRGLVVSGDRIPPPRAALVDTAGKPVGDVRSTARSPRRGIIGLAMVRREVAPPAAVTVTLGEGDLDAHVVALPFTDDDRG